MPSIDDTFNHTDDELLDFDDRSTNAMLALPASDSINFVPEHFGDSSSDEETLMKGLDFGNNTINTDGNQVAEAEARFSSAAGNFVSQTLSLMVGGAFSGITNLTNTAGLARGGNSNIPPAVTYKSNDEVDFVDQNADLDSPGDNEDVTLDDSDIADIADEFEFLDQYDIEDADA